MRQSQSEPETGAVDDVLRYEESRLYEEKIRRLEDSVSALRLSRRILISLLEQVNAEEKRERERLLADNRRLRKTAQSYALRLWQLQSERSEVRG